MYCLLTCHLLPFLSVFLTETSELSKKTKKKKKNQVMSLSCFKNPPIVSQSSYVASVNLSNPSAPLVLLILQPHLLFLEHISELCTCWLLYLKCFSPDHHMAGSFLSIRSRCICAPHFFISPVGRSLWSGIIIKRSSKATSPPEIPLL